MMQRLMFLITGLGLGGAETQLVALSRCLKKRGWELLVVSLTPPKTFVGELEAMGIPVVSLEMCRRASDFRGAVQLVRLIRSWRPQVLHAHMIHANILARLVRPLTPLPVLVCTAHNTYEVSGRARGFRELTWRERAYRLTDPLCDLTTQVSQAGLGRYVRVKAVPRHKVRLIPNGVDVVRFQPDHDTRSTMRASLKLEDPFVWLAVGRLEEQKDYPTMLRAFATVIQKHNKTVLLVVGDGTLGKELRRLASDLGLDDRVRFLGMRRDVGEIMNAADGFVISSAWEGFPIVLVEAMACALPIVATDSGGPREILDGGRLGFVVPPGDPGPLGQAMQEMMALPEGDRRQIGDRARHWVEERFDMERIVDQWEALYLELLARNEGRPRRIAPRME